MHTDTELYKFAQTELDLLLEEERKANLNVPIETLEQEYKLFGNMTPQEFMNQQILDVIASIDSKKHSGGSLNYMMNVITHLVRFHNLTPLTLADNEFVLVAEDEKSGKIYQNIRNFSVFKSDKQGVYHLDGPDELARCCGEAPEEREVANESTNE